jgi:hypothetical protein
LKYSRTLGCFDDAHWGEGGPGIASLGGELEAGGLEFGLIAGGVLEIGDDGGAAGFQDAGDLLAGFVAAFAGGNVVDAGERNDYVEGVVGKSERSGVAIEHFDAVLYSFEFGVAECALLFVGGEIDLAPEIDAGGAAGGEALGRADQEQARAGADVEDVFVTAPVHQVQHAVAMLELSVLRVAQHEDAADEAADAGVAEHRGKQEGDVAHGEVRQKAEQQQANYAGDKKIADYAGSVDAIVRLGGCIAHELEAFRLWRVAGRMTVRRKDIIDAEIAPAPASESEPTF